MTITQIDNTTSGTFQAKEGDVIAGEMTYSWITTNKISVDHTEVNSDFSGKGVGKLLLMDLVKFARKNNIKIVPLCSYVKSVFDKVEEIRDVLS